MDCNKLILIKQCYFLTDTKFFSIEKNPIEQYHDHNKNTEQ